MTFSGKKGGFLGSLFGGGGDPNTSNTVISDDAVEVILAISEGPIEGLVDGMKSFLVGETPLVSPDGTPNFFVTDTVNGPQTANSFSLLSYNGAPDGETISANLGGFGSATGVNVQFATNTPLVRTVLQHNIDFIDLRILINSLYWEELDGGSVVATHPYDLNISIEWKRESDSGYHLSIPYVVTSLPGTIVNTNQGRRSFWQGTAPDTTPLISANWFNSSDNDRPQLLTVNGGSFADFPMLVYVDATTNSPNAPYWQWQEVSNTGSTTVPRAFVIDSGSISKVQSPIGPGREGDYWLVTDLNTIRYHNGTGWVTANDGTSPPSPDDSDFVGDGTVMITERITTSPVVWQIHIPVPNVDENINIRLIKTSPSTGDIPSSGIHSDCTWESLTSIIGSSFSFQNLAVSQLNIIATNNFTSIPDFSGIYKGRIVKVPSNYDPNTRTYSGTWDGIWKLAWTDNAAFVAKDLAENTTYGIGAYYPMTINDFDVYDAGVWCDHICPDGSPRFTFNTLISDPRVGREALDYVCGIFSGRLVDDGNGSGRILIDSSDTNAVQLFTKENVEDGVFRYSFTDVPTRYNDLTIIFTNPNLGWVEDRRRLFDQSKIDTYGRIPFNFVAFGCISEAEAYRRGRYVLITSQTETTTIQFNTARQGCYLQPYNIILVADDAIYGTPPPLEEITGYMLETTPSTFPVLQADNAGDALFIGEYTPDTNTFDKFRTGRILLGPQGTILDVAKVPNTRDLERLVQATTVIPGGEFSYDTIIQTRDSSIPENKYTTRQGSDWSVAIDDLHDMLPQVNTVLLAVTWFGDDLRCDHCQIRPKIESSSRVTSPNSWQVHGLTHGTALVLTAASYTGTPSDDSVVRAILDLKARGYTVVLCPTLLMDIPSGNALTNPYTGSAPQPAYPWRGRITCNPTSIDQTSGAATQVSSFFGTVTTGQMSVSVDWVTGAVTTNYTGPVEWHYRRFILHYANLCATINTHEPGAVGAFLLGSELVGLCAVRDSSTHFPTVSKLKTLAADVRTVLGSDVKLSYAAHSSDYGRYQPSDGLFFHLDPLWSDANIDFIGINMYEPLSDWRNGSSHLDALAGYKTITDLTYLQANIEGGENYDWTYTSLGNRNSQIRTSITDFTYGKPWALRSKDIRNWWLNQHYDRPGGVQNVGATDWVPQSKPIWFTSLAFPSVDRATNQPDIVYDPKSSESGYPYYSSGAVDNLIQRQGLQATLSYWASSLKNPVSSVYHSPMIQSIAVANWDARPYPAWPARSDFWFDGDLWSRGYWVNGKLGLADVSISKSSLVTTDARTVLLRDPVYIEPGFTYYVTFQTLNEPVEYQVDASWTGTKYDLKTTTDIAPLPDRTPFYLRVNGFTTAPKPYRVMTISGDDPNLVEITAVEVNRTKWDYVDGVAGGVEPDFAPVSDTFAPSTGIIQTRPAVDWAGRIMYNLSATPFNLVSHNLDTRALISDIAITDTTGNSFTSCDNVLLWVSELDLIIGTHADRFVLIDPATAHIISASPVSVVSPRFIGQWSYQYDSMSGVLAIGFAEPYDGQLEVISYNTTSHTWGSYGATGNALGSISPGSNPATLYYPVRHVVSSGARNGFYASGGGKLVFCDTNTGVTPSLVNDLGSDIKAIWRTDDNMILCWLANGNLAKVNHLSGSVVYNITAPFGFRGEQGANPTNYGGSHDGDLITDSYVGWLTEFGLGFFRSTATTSRFFPITTANVRGYVTFDSSRKSWLETSIGAPPKFFQLVPI